MTYRSIRQTKPGVAAAEFEGRYRPVGPTACGNCGPLAHWLTERYCLYSSTSRHLYRADIHHAMWPLQLAEAEITKNTMTLPLGISLPETAPLVHFSRKLEVSAWKPAKIVG
jgi:uncharacterized protein YqjF (DUF2071 family)